MSVGQASGRLQHADVRVQRLIDLYESLAPAQVTGPDLGALNQVYREDAHFKDPFNAVQGLPAIAAIFRHMFDTLEAPRFQVLQAVAERDLAFLTWDFHFRTRGEGGRAMTIHGASQVQFGADGRVAAHRDYWDAAEELYEKLPLIGGLMRWLKRRAAG